MFSERTRAGEGGCLRGRGRLSRRLAPCSERCVCLFEGGPLSIDLQNVKHAAQVRLCSDATAQAAGTTMPNCYSHSPEPPTKEMTIKVGLGSTNRIALYGPRTTADTGDHLFTSMAFGHVTASRLAVQMGYKGQNRLSRD